VENAGCVPGGEYTGIEAPLPELSAAARALGSIRSETDSDGTWRRAPLLYRYRGRYYPSLALALAAPFLHAPGAPAGGGDSPAARFDCRGALYLGNQRIPLVPGSSTALIYWYGPYDKAFRHFPVWQVFNSALALNNGRPPAVSPAEFRDKIVLIGPSASGIGDLHATPLSPVYPGVDVNATLISNLLQNDFVTPVTLSWSLMVILLLALATSIAVWQFDHWPTYTGVTLALLGAFLGVNFGLFWWARVSLLMAAPLAAAATSFAAGNLGRYVTEGREKRRYRSTLMKYVAPTIVEAMMKDRRLAELSNEKRELTVLFSDVRSFTSLSEKLPVDELVKTLNEFLNGMVTVIFANGGTLDKFVGDCVMAFWGAPILQPNHAELAARSALEMQAALERLNQKWRAQGRPELRIGVGINTGEMILGNIGSEQRMDFTVIGDNVNLASRLESSTKELKASIVISDATYQRIQHLAEVRDLGIIHVKGKDVGIRVYELLGMGREESPSYASAQG
jgi:adenylate cyclase